MKNDKEPGSYVIPDDIFDEVNEVTHAIIDYKNPNKLTWAKAYDDILIQMGKEDQLKNYRLLTFVVRRISELGYDIYDKPFRMKRYR